MQTPSGPKRNLRPAAIPSPSALALGLDSLGIDDHGLGEPLAGLEQAVQAPEVRQRALSAQGLDGNHHLSPADQAICPGVIVVEHESTQGRPHVPELADGVLLDLVLDTAASQRSGLTTGGIDDHDRPGLLRGRTLRLHDLAEDLLATLFQGFDQCS